ncbi:MAG: hypothetical protein MI867_27470 [Pseudomonadales bacterium]|nr:hypothetical protein [Pseudomonadales bacterium]
MLAKSNLRKCILGVFFVASIAVAEEVLSEEFLQYLAGFETEDGEWIDPEELDMMAQLGSEASDSSDAMTREVSDNE